MPRQPSYIEKIDQVMTNISFEMRIVYIESDYPDVLHMVLDKTTGSVSLRKWLGIKKFGGFEDAVKEHCARPLTAVYEEHGSYGILKDSSYYKKQRNITDNSTNPIQLTLDSQGKSEPVYYRGTDGRHLCFRVNTMAEEDSKYIPADQVIDLKNKPVHKYIIGKNVLNFQIGETTLLKDRTISNSSCHFFYLSNADALEKPVLSRMLQAFLESKDIYTNAKLILTGTTRCIPDTLTGQVQLVRLSSPSFEDIRQQLESKLREECGFKLPFDKKQMEEFSRILSGLTHLQLENVYAYLGEYLVDELKEDGIRKLSEAVWRQKKIESEKDSTLVYKKIEENPGVVGIGNFLYWLNQNLMDLANPEEARKYGLTPPRGVILAGVPGTGKTQLAKQMAYQWGNFDAGNPRPVSFIEFNIGSLSSSKYGESEEKMDRFLARISEQEPAILFIDEIEKTFYRDEPNKQGMHEVKKQQMARLLGWLQEHQENIFTFITANNISILPPELIRSGRLSERFIVFLPNYVELMSMLYTFLLDKTKLNIFEEEFNEEIIEKCGVIEEYSKNYGLDSEKYIEFDKKLSDTLKESTLADVLISLVRNAINPMKDFERRKELCKEPKPWEKWMTDSSVNMRTPFLTGADMKELVRNTILQLRRKKANEKWTGQDFAKTMEECCGCAEFTPYGQSNMDKLVELYLSCDYRDASAHSLLPKSQFNAKDGVFNLEGQYIFGTNPDNLYDQYLQRALMQEIENAAGEKAQEKNRQKRRDRLEQEQESHIEFQREQMERQRKQWQEDDAEKNERKQSEKDAREIQKIQLKKLKSE